MVMGGRRWGASLALVAAAGTGGACQRSDAALPTATTATSAQPAPPSSGAPSVAALGAAFVVRTQAELDDAGIGPNGEPFGAIRGAFVKPFCREVPLGKPFRGDAAWKNAKIVRAGGGFVDAARLVVERPRGWVMTPIAWDDTGRSVRATPEFEPLALASLEVKSDALEVSVDGVAMITTGGSATQAPARRISRCTDAGAEISCTPLATDR
jgi:hypothetical protein